MTRGWVAKVAASILLLYLASSGATRAYSPTTFRGAAIWAPIVVLAVLADTGHSAEEFVLVRVVRGKAFKKDIAIGQPGGFDVALPIAERLTRGNTYLLLLTDRNEPFVGMSFCGTTNALLVVGGEVRDLHAFDPALVPRGKVSLTEVEAILATDQRSK